MFMKLLLISFFLFLGLMGFSRQPDQVVHSNIRSVKLFKYGEPTGYPILQLNGNDKLELHFDDMDADVKNYYYTYQLRNADWSPTLLRPFDYIQGFQDVRISTYRQSSLAFTRYTHYRASIPDRNSVPTRSGNYLLKVFLNGDTSKLAFTKRFFVVDVKATIRAQVQQPFNAQLFRTHQKLQVVVNTDSRINIFNPQDIKVVVLQNFAWPTALELNKPNVYRGNYFEYYDEAATVFPAGKEWRWLDLRSLRLLSDRMEKLVKKPDLTTEVYVKPDGDRTQKPYIYYRDQNGLYSIENMDGNNPYWQSDYAFVHFSFVPPGNKAYEGRSIYLYGELTNYLTDADTKMYFNEDKGIYEKTLYLKQGFYNYSYVSIPDSAAKSNKKTIFNTEGDYWGTENMYTILVYYRPFGGRADELIGYSTISSVFQRMRNEE